MTYDAEEDARALRKRMDDEPRPDVRTRDAMRALTRAYEAGRESRDGAIVDTHLAVCAERDEAIARAERAEAAHQADCDAYGEALSNAWNAHASAVDELHTLRTRIRALAEGWEREESGDDESCASTYASELRALLDGGSDE